MIKLFRYNVLLSDNKPANILLKYDSNYSYFNLYLTDFGGSYIMNRDTARYPKFSTRFYFDEELYLKHQEFGTEYSLEEKI